MIQVRGTEGYALGDGMRFDKGTCNAAILPIFFWCYLIGASKKMFLLWGWRKEKFYTRRFYSPQEGCRFTMLQLEAISSSRSQGR